MGKILLIFSMFIFLNLDEITINDYYQLNNLKIEYGAYMDNGYLSIYDLENDEYINEVIYDDGFLEEFIYLAQVSNNSFIIVCKRSFYLGEELKLNDYILLKYNLMGELIGSESISNTYTNFYNHHHTLVLEKNGIYSYLNEDFQIASEFNLKTNYIGNYKVQNQGEAYINGEYASIIELTYPGHYEIEIVDDNYSFQYSIILEPDIIIEGELENGNYFGEIRIYSFGELYLNNQQYQSGEVINQVGKYKFEVEGINNYYKAVDFSLYPYIYYYNGIDSFILNEEKEINQPIRIYASVNQLLMNNEIYNNEMINQPGKYILSYEQNGVSENIEFIIYPRVEGISDGNIYSDLDLYIFGEAYINDKLYSGKVSFNQPGKYVLELYFDNELYKSIDFEIINETNIVDKFQYIKYGFIFLLGIGGLIFFWKK